MSASYQPIPDSEKPPFTRAEAIAQTEDIRNSLVSVHYKILCAHDRKAHIAMGYSRWDDYVQGEFSISKTRAHQLMEFARVLQIIGVPEPAAKTEILRKPLEIKGEFTMVTTPPAPSERSIREMARVPDGQKAAVYEIAKAKTPGKPPTAKAVRAAVDSALPQEEPKPKPDAGARAYHARVAASRSAEELSMELEATQDELREVTAILDAIHADDIQKQIIAEKEKFRALSGRCQQLQTTAHEAGKTAQYYQGITNQIKKQLGVEKIAQIIPTIKLLQGHVG